MSPFISDWNKADHDGNMILHHAIVDRFVRNELIAELISLGADPRRKNKLSQKTLHILTHNYSKIEDKAEKIARALLDAGAYLEAKDAQGRTPLHCLINGMSHGNRHILSFIKEFGADFKAIDYEGNSIMHFFLQAVPSDTVFLELLDLGVDLLGVNSGGENLLHMLMRSESARKPATIPDQIILRLSKEGISSTLQDERGNTPLHLLCQQTSKGIWNSESPKGSKGTIMLGLEDGKAIRMKNDDGLQPIQLAVTTNAILSERLISKDAPTMIQTNER